MTSAFIKKKKGGEFRHKDSHTGKMLCNDKGRDLRNPSISQERPKIASKPPEARKE